MDPAGFLRKYGGSYADLFNATEAARAGDPHADPDLRALSPQELVHLNRFAQTGDQPALALAAAPYEGLKGLEQTTGIPVLTKLADLLGPAGGAIRPGPTTSPASWGNVVASYKGAGSRLLDAFRRGGR